MTDIRLPLGGVKFSVRVALLCVRGDSLLATTEPGLPFWYLPGGALRVDEDAASGAEREWREETGLAPGPLRLVGVVENLFSDGGTAHHEIGFYFRMEAPLEVPAEPFRLLDRPEFRYDWVHFDRLTAQPVYPLAAHPLLHVPEGTVRHVVNRETRS